MVVISKPTRNFPLASLTCWLLGLLVGLQSSVGFAQTSLPNVKCGRDSAYLVFQRLGFEKSIESVDRALDYQDQTSLIQLRGLFESNGLECAAIAVSTSEMQQIASSLQGWHTGAAAIAAIPLPGKPYAHFVVVLGGDKDSMQIIDTAGGGRVERVQYADARFADVPVLVVGSPYAVRRVVDPTVFDFVFGAITYAISSYFFAPLLLLLALIGAFAGRAKLMLPGIKRETRQKVVRVVVGTGILIGVGVIVMILIVPEGRGLEPVQRAVSMGAVPLGTTQTVAVAVRNSSDEMVLIDQVLGGCSCMTPLDFERRVAPGEEITIPVEILVESVGVTALNLAVIPQDGREFAVTINYEGVQTSRLEPTQFQTASYPLGRKSRQIFELAVVDYEGPPLPVRAETLSGHDTVHVKLLDPQVISESGTLRLEVSCSPQSEIGVFTSKLRISSVVDHPKMGLLSYIVNVHGDFAPAVSVSPEVLVLSDDQYGPPQIRISSLVGGLESLQVTRSGAASLSFRPHVTGDSGQVRLTLNDIQYSGEEAAYVVLKLAGGKEKISIPVHSLGSVGP